MTTTSTLTQWSNGQRISRSLRYRNSLPQQTLQYAVSHPTLDTATKVFNYIYISRGRLAVFIFVQMTGLLFLRGFCGKVLVFLPTHLTKSEVCMYSMPSLTSSLRLNVSLLLQLSPFHIPSSHEYVDSSQASTGPDLIQGKPLLSWTVPTQREPLQVE